MTFLDESVAVLSRTPAAFDTLLRDLPDVLTEATEGPGTWSPRDVVAHLIHCEHEDWMPRLDIILANGPAFTPFDREGHSRYSAGKTMPTLLDEFLAMRRANLARLKAMNLQPAQLELTGTHPAFGAVTARQLLATWTAHDLAHILQVSRTMAKRYRQDVGPWAEYMSVMK